MKEYKDKKFLSKISTLYYLKNLTQQEIAKKLNLSRTKVSRYLEKARKEKIVEIKINNSVESFDGVEYEIEKKYGLKECLIVPSGRNEKEIISQMSTRLSKILERILKEGDYLGINWGNTLKQIIDSMEVEKEIKINVVPMMGGLGQVGTDVQINSIAKTIADKFGGTNYEIHTPAVLDSKEVRDGIEKDSSLRGIENLIDKISVALIGISFTGKDSTLIKTGVFSEEDFNNLKKIGVVGDVNLTFIDKDGKFVNTYLDERIIRFSFEKIKKISNIIAIAYGNKKVIPIKAVLKAGLINILITDINTASQILRS